MKLSKTVVLATAAAFVLMTAGCHLIMGGGWFYGLGGEKVTFGFQAQCKNDYNLDGTVADWFYTGQFQYKDKANNARFHGNITFDIGLLAPPGTCEESADELEALADIFFPGNTVTAIFSGECWSQPDKIPGFFEVEVTDNGTPGFAGDIIQVTADCVPAGGYFNTGILGGGNIVEPGH